MNEKEILQRIHAVSQRTGYQEVGDDAAFLGGLVISTDQFIEDVHFRWDWQSAQSVGYKGVVQALSDLAASSTPPSGLLISASWPPQDQEKIDQALQGIEEACLEYRMPLIGGDVSRSEKTYFDFVVFGFNKTPSKKSGARPGDLLAVTGPLGSAHGGWLSLQKGWASPALIDAFRRPQAQIATALRLAQASSLTSATDTSDSFSKSIYDLARASGCGFDIHLERLPVHPELQQLAKDHSLDWQEAALHGGEDYQLLVTLSPDSSEKLISDLRLSVIGSVQSGAKVRLIEGEKISSLSEVGWDPFRL